MEAKTHSGKAIPFARGAVLALFCMSLIVCVTVNAHGMTINGGAAFTNSRDVTLSTNMPSGCTQVQVWNDGGSVSSYSPAATIPWTLSDGEGQKNVNATYYYTYTYQCGTYVCGSYCCGGYSWGSCRGWCNNYCPSYCEGASSTGDSASITLDTTPPSILISAPSADVVDPGGSASYLVTYSGASAVTLTTADVTVNTTGSATANVQSVSQESAQQWRVLLSGIGGIGTVGISIASGTAADVAGNYSLSAGPSTTFSITTIPVASTATAASSVSLSGFTANWGAVPTATGYRLDVATDDIFSSFVAGYNDKDVSNVTGYAITGLNPETNYYYRVRAYNGVGTGPSSNTIMANTSLRTLTVSVAGSGGGSVGSTPTGIACSGSGGPGCSFVFAGGIPVSLSALPDWKSLFGGWGGDCSGMGGCNLVMDRDKTVNVTFVPNLQVKVMPAGTTYASLKDAYNSVPDGGSVAARVFSFMEDLDLNRAITITFEGGQDGSYQNCVGYSTLQGTLSVGTGCIIVENLIIQ